jgi:hypothetical protein
VKSKLSIVGLSVVAVLAALGIFLPLPGATTQELTITHGVVEASSTTGEGLGVVRTFFVDTNVDGVGADGQYLVGTLTTLTGDVKNNREIRGSDLVFVMGSEADQLVVGGISFYPQSGETLADGQDTVRPIIGGSGTYRGAAGQVTSTNLGADGWSHVFEVFLP